MCKYQKDRIPHLQFDTLEPPDFSVLVRPKTSFFITPEQKEALPAGKDINALRRDLSLLFTEKLSNKYPQLEARCDINRDTFQKVLRFKNGRNITYKLLAKFCVGARLSEAQTRKLFEYMDYHLTDKNLADYILLCNLHNGCTIDEYLADLQKYLR